MKKIYLLVLTLTAFAYGNGSAQFKNYDFTYEDHIKSVQITVNGIIQNVPILRLNSRDYMILTFDDLGTSEDDYYYRIVHCDRNWEKSGINEIDYIDGFPEEVIRVWEFSQITEVEYTHFWIQLPNRDTRMLISGNYLIHVYQKSGGEIIPMLTRRFVITESNEGVLINNVRSSDMSVDRFVQQFDLSVVAPEEIQNPMRDISVDIIQNGLWTQSVHNVKPFGANGNVVKFDPFGSISFPGLAEYRNFDTRIRLGGGRGVEKVTLQYGRNIAKLYPDQNRGRSPYLFDFDFNGRYFIDTRDALRNTTEEQLQEEQDAFKIRASFSYESRLIDGEYSFLQKDIKSDYMDVEFSLLSRPVANDVYIFGAFTDWQLRPEYKMTYDYDDEAYKGHARLKQGYYDYMYATTDRDGNLDLQQLEGSWYHTENEYTVLVYFREFATRYDRVISARAFNSGYR